jgi:hypothetical protein
MRESARDILSKAGHPPTVALLRRIGTSLHAIAVAGSFAPDANGRLVVDREAPGFEAMEGTSWPARERPTKQSSRDVSERQAGMPRAEARPSPGIDAARQAALEKERIVASMRRELDGLGQQLSQHTSVIARANSDLEAVEAARAKLDTERKAIEKARARAEDDAARVRSRMAEIERSLRKSGART